MDNNTFTDKFKAFFGIGLAAPRNDFRNPIWGSDDDEDDGDELYTRDRNLYDDSMEMQRKFSQQLHDMIRSFGAMFGDVNSLFNENLEDIPSITDQPAEGNGLNTGNIRDYYLKPGYHHRQQEHLKEDVDLDGKISSNEISGLLKQKGDTPNSTLVTPFNGNMVPGRSFCQTIITTSVTKPDGTTETRRIVKSGNEVLEESTTVSGPEARGFFTPNMDQITSTGVIYNQVLSELSSLLRNFY